MLALAGLLDRREANFIGSAGPPTLDLSVGK
jgi:hypothetical protein